MKKLFRTKFLSLFLSFFFVINPPANAAVGKKAMVVTADPLATQAALNILKRGGNAVDAAVAAQWVLNVVEPQSSGIGGGGFFLYYEAKTRQVFAFDGREKAPADITPELYLDSAGKPIPYVPDRVTGGHSVGVPGILKLLKTVHERFGSKKFNFENLFDPAIQIAEEGFKVSERLARFFDGEKERLAVFEASRAIFLDEYEDGLRAGTHLIQKDLAGTFRLIKEKGIAVFYEGEIADAIVACVRRAPYRPGVMKKTDLAAYEVVEREAVYGRYRGFDIFSMSPPSSGGVTLLETLNILEHFDVKDRNSFLHYFAMAQRYAFGDRNLYLGDPDFQKMPLEKLLSKDLGQNYANQILRPDAPLPVKMPQEVGAHTSHISITDEWGNMVSFTTTIEHIFGSAMMVPGYGFLLNNELSDFDAEPRNENGNLKPNAPEPGKKPRSSMTPVLIFREGNPFLIAGSPGGSTIIGTVLNIVVNMIDFKMPLEEALRTSKIINRGTETELEPFLFEDEELKRSLEDKGHKVKRAAPFGNAQVIHFDQTKEGEITGASDMRGEGQPLGY